VIEKEEEIYKPDMSPVEIAKHSPELEVWAKGKFKEWVG